MNEPETLNLSGLLRQATHAIHQRLEAHLPLMRADLTEHDYREHVAALAPLVTAFEQALAPHGATLRSLAGGAALTPRAHLVQHDARVLHIPFAQARAQALGVQVEALGMSWARAAGCHYVLQGSRIGGQLIHRHLRQVLPAGLHAALSYYGACGGAQARAYYRWMRALDADRALWAQRTQVVDAALETFAIWHETLCVKLPEEGTR